VFLFIVGQEKNIGRTSVGVHLKDTRASNATRPCLGHVQKNQEESQPSSHSWLCFASERVLVS